MLTAVRRRFDIEAVHEPGEIEERPGESVHLIYDDAINSSRFHVVEEPLQGGPIKVPAAEPAVIIARRNQFPTGAFLARNVGFGQLTLRVERVKLLFQSLLC